MALNNNSNGKDRRDCETVFRHGGLKVTDIHYEPSTMGIRNVHDVCKEDESCIC